MHGFSKNHTAAAVREQARLRLMVGAPSAIGGSVLLLHAGISQHVVWTTSAAYLFYCLSMLFVATNSADEGRAKRLVMAGAILDPVMLTWWLGISGQYGGLVLGLYLFTVLGNGFRVGLQAMRICQGVSIAGYLIVLAMEPFWQQHITVWLSFMITVVVVPLYAAKLITSLHKARGHAERESLAKSHLLATVSHELRTPLHGIVASAQLIDLETKGEGAGGRAKTILSLANDLLREITNLLDSAKHEAHALTLEVAPFKLTDQIDKVRLALATTATNKGIKLHTTMDPRITAMVHGDSHYLSRVLLNLVGNAVKFTDTGRVDLAIQLIDEMPSECRVRFTVTDTGVGIPKELHQKIFDPFFQAERGVTRRYGGTGLGMSIADQIVKLMGGHIDIDSTPGKGSAFTFAIALPKVAIQPRAEGETSWAKTVRGKRILVADDNETNLRLMSELLQTDDHKVTVVTGGRGALEELSKQEFDVIFLDFHMHDMDGAKVLRLYRFGKLRPAPTFFLTADATEAATNLLRESGAKGILHKPISMAKLRQAIFDATGEPGLAHVATSAERVARAEGAQERGTSPLTVVSTQHIDYNAIIELQSMSSRPEFVEEVITQAITDIERNCSLVRAGLDENDVLAVRDAAHALKGVCASVGAVRLQALAGNLCHITRDELTESSGRYLATIDDAAAHAIANLKAVTPQRVSSK